MQLLTFFIVACLGGYLLWQDLSKRIDRVSRRGFSAGSYKMTVRPFKALRDHYAFRLLTRNQKLHMTPIEITYLAGENAYWVKESSDQDLVLRTGRTLTISDKLVAGKEDGKYMRLLIREETHARIAGKPSLVCMI